MKNLAMISRREFVTLAAAGLSLASPKKFLALSQQGVVGSPRSLSADEAPADWLIETTSPGNLVRAGGWRRDVVKPGDEVEVTFHPEREAGKKSGLLMELKTLSTGEVFTANIRDQEKPGLE